jgi:hypothetical protein
MAPLGSANRRGLIEQLDTMALADLSVPGSAGGMPARHCQRGLLIRASAVSSKIERQMGAASAWRCSNGQLNLG